MKPLTHIIIERLQPPARGQVDVYDRGFRGLCLRVSQGGRKSWYLMHRDGGKLKRHRLGEYPVMTLAAARDAWRAARADLAGGRAIRKGGRGELFSDVVQEWLERDQSKNKSSRDTIQFVNRELLPLWGHRPVGDISRRDVRDMVDSIAERAPVMARRGLAYTNRFFNWAVGRDVVESNPCFRLEKPGKETKRNRTLDDKELLKVWQVADEMGWPFGQCVQLLILTGARLNEIAGATWSELGDDALVLEGARTKNGEPHSIFLSSAAQLVIRELPRLQGSDLMFSTNGRNPVSGWSKCKDELDKSGVKNWRLHDLRRTVATNLQKMGVPLQVTEFILGHVGGSKSGITGVYQTYKYEAESRAALEAWAAHVSALVEGKQRGKVVPLRRG